MTTPITPVPAAIEPWVARSSYLRWIDAAAAWLVLVAIGMTTLGQESGRTVVLAALAVVIVGMWVRPLRARWRPISGWIALRVSHSLRPGDRAWFVRPGRADSVLITGRRGVRLSLAGGALGDDETISERRTRVFIVPHGGP